MGGENCAIFQCTAQRSYNKGLSYHKIPKKGVSEKNDAWREQLLHKIDRADSWFMEEKRKPNAKIFVCSRHFKPECFRKGDGPKKYLIHGSIPTENMPLKQVPIVAPIPRKDPFLREPPPEVKRVANITLQDVLRDARRLPEGWLLLSADEHCVICAIIEGDIIKVRVIIDANLTASVRVLGLPAAHLKEDLESIRLHCFLSKLTNMKLCSGVTDTDLQKYSKLPTTHSSQTHFVHTTLVCPQNEPYTTSCIRSSKCRLLNDQELCNQCLKVKKLLEKKKCKQQDAEQQPLNKHDPLLTAPHTKLKKEVKELRKTNKCLEKQLTSIRACLKDQSISLQPEMHKELNQVLSAHEKEIDDDFTRLFWQEQVKAFNSKDRGMKWHPMMIRLALLLHSRGPGVYNTLRDTGVLKLPGESTLRDYSNYIHPKAGFNPDVIGELKAHAVKLNNDQRFVVLLHDEMSIKEDLVWDSKSGKLVGFVNLERREDDFKNIASHVLVFYVVGINSSLKFSLGFFGTRSAAAYEICPIFWKSVGVLEQQCKLKVIASTSDKAAPNQRLYQMHGSSDNICYKTINFYAYDGPRDIFFFSDVPHLIKTVRNNLLRSGPGKTNLLWNNGKEIIWSHIIRVYSEDSRQQLTRRHKLTHEHVYPRSHSLMKVKLAAQVLSKSVGTVLNGQDYSECHETARLILYMNRFFDCLNTRSFDEAARKRNTDLKPYTCKNDERFKFFDDFLAYLNEWKQSVNSRPGNFTQSERGKMFLTHQTFKGLVMTVNSFKEVCHYLLDNGVNFVLSNRFCQDPLEAHFGRHRAIGRRSENPTLHSFGYQENKMRLQRDLAMKLQPKGNVEKRKRKDIPVMVSKSPVKKLKR